MMGPNKGLQKEINDNESVQTMRRDNVHQTRGGLHFTVPPSSNEPDKKLCLQMQKWFSKMREIDDKFSLIPWKVADKNKRLFEAQRRFIT